MLSQNAAKPSALTPMAPSSSRPGRIRSAARPPASRPANMPATIAVTPAVAAAGLAPVCSRRASAAQKVSENSTPMQRTSTVQASQ